MDFRESNQTLTSARRVVPCDCLHPLCKIDYVLAALGSIVRFCREPLSPEARTKEALQERGFLTGGPESDFSTGLEGLMDKTDAAAVVDARVFRLHEGGRAVIDIEQNGIIPAISSVPEDFKYVRDQSLDAGIIQESTVHLPEKLAIPGYDVGEQLRDFDRRVATAEFEHPSEAVPQAKSADEHAGFCAVCEPFARQLRQPQFRNGGGGAHELPSVELQKILAVVLVKGQLRSIRGAGLAKISNRFQSELEVRCAMGGCFGQRNFNSAACSC